MNQGNIVTKGAQLARPATQVENEISNLQSSNKALIERCHALRQRLASVLRETPQGAVTETPQEMLVPLAEELRDIGKTTAAAINMLDDITNSLEVPVLGENT